MPSTDGAESAASDGAATCAGRPDGAATCAASATCAGRHDGGCGGASGAIRDESIRVGDDGLPFSVAALAVAALAVAVVVLAFLY